MIEPIKPFVTILNERPTPSDNEFELIYEEHFHFDPTKDPAASRIAHKGGLGTARTEHY